MKKIRKAIFPVAGLGTRFLPATKANPKEMLPIVDKPLIQYAAEEAVHAGIEELVFVTGRNKRSIPDHFDKAYELEAELDQLEKQRAGDRSTEAERHQLALQEVLTELQQRIDEYHELAGADSVDGQANWQQLDKDLKDLDSDLYGAN